jgi:hypothetical protein
MKREFKKNKTQFNIRLNQEEFKLIKELKEDFSINISRAFKNFLKKHLEYLRKERGIKGV